MSSKILERNSVSPSFSVKRKKTADPVITSEMSVQEAMIQPVTESMLSRAMWPRRSLEQDFRDNVNLIYRTTYCARNGRFISDCGAICHSTDLAIDKNRSAKRAKGVCSSRCCLRRSVIPTYCADNRPRGASSSRINIYAHAIPTILIRAGKSRCADARGLAAPPYCVGSIGKSLPIHATPNTHIVHFGKCPR